MDERIILEISKLNIEDENFVDKINEILKKNKIELYKDCK